jgi:hypothetical protein
MRRGALYYGGQAVGRVLGAVVALLAFGLLLMAALLAMATTLGLWAVGACGWLLSLVGAVLQDLGRLVGRPWSWWRLHWRAVWDALPEWMGSRRPEAAAAPEYGLCNGCKRTTLVVPNPVGGVYVCSECGSDRVERVASVEMRPPAGIPTRVISRCRAVH